MQRPNILLLYTDQQRWDALGANGNPAIKTPNLDRLAADGLNFDHFFVQNPVCMPSRLSFLTGQYCSTLQVLINGVPVPENTQTLPQMLHNYGYASANIGKLHFLPHANRDHRSIHPSYGFDHLEISDEPGCYEDAYRAWVRRKDPDELEFASLGLPPASGEWEKITRVGDNVPHPPERFPKKAQPYRGGSEFTHTAFVAEQTMQFLGQQGDSPFFCIAGFYSPHSPWVAPQEFLDLYDPNSLPLPHYPRELEQKRAETGKCPQDELRSATHGYYAMVSEVDHHVGRILDCLEARGLRDNTIVVFTSDHGEFLGEFLNYGKGYPSPDCISRVPMIIRWPDGVDQPGRTIPHITEAVDVIPTLLQCCGIPLPRHLQGTPLPMSPGASKTRTSALTEMQGSKALRTAQFRYVVRANGSEFLYDLNQPGGQYRNVAAADEYADDLARVRHTLIRRLLEQERHLPRTVQY
ncbi:MAG: sulfatase-like hydrolase/transferase [Lentisphaerae bacterium]|jgi:arylsulfatase|nr:sulfatase-like hydrolase/transferase [Lentisphaerota bacterium]MBT4819994.1 sulfatase-like hydrolase/transferase [Lentisphaerota bacterium]MBT5612284.1 sulfatase-like hydrolase/transferase [Lentisphaerota bacterium]MBT7060738.1 sulfatase-like hydrolase/transferase [Lentisphaerota bacterium]MBT7845263.1 sulfatase-like hydrolase/transferase [Lentisphaerota bacterium]